MAFLKHPEGEKEDFTVDIWNTEHGSFGVSGFNMDGKEVGPYCHLCKVELESKPKIGDHLMGKKHQTKMKTAVNEKTFVVESSTGMENDPNNLFLPNYCKVCEADLTTVEQQEGHYMSEKHQKKVRFYFLCKVGVKEAHPSKVVDQEEREKELEGLTDNEYCSLCKCEFTSYVVAQSHYTGKKHAKKLREQADKQDELDGNDWKTCKFCDIKLNSQFQLLDHENSAKHKANVKQHEEESEIVFTEWTVPSDNMELPGLEKSK